MTKREAEVVRILQMKIVKEIKRICQENNFSFFSGCRINARSSPS